MHVGPNKTGTTALQYAFVANTGRLARHHIAYPMTGQVLNAHHGVANACRTNDGQILSDLTDEIRWENTVLLSSELFAVLEPHELERILHAFDEASVEVVYTLRRLPELWLSHWKEMVKHGLHLSFPEYMARHAETDRSAFRAPPSPTYQLRVLTQVFGHKCLRLVDYDARFGSETDFGVGFARDVLRLGDQSSAFVTEKLNQTPADWLIEALRHLNLRANGKLDAAGKRLLANNALCFLNTHAPEWTTSFKTLFHVAETEKLSSESPRILSEQAEVLRGYRDRLIDPVDALMAKSETTVRTLDENRINDEIRAELDALFDRLSRQSTDI